MVDWYTCTNIALNKHIRCHIYKVEMIHPYYDECERNVCVIFLFQYNTCHFDSTLINEKFDATAATDQYKIAVLIWFQLELIALKSIVTINNFFG